MVLVVEKLLQKFNRTQPEQ